MTRRAKAILLALVIGVGHPMVGWGVSSAMFTEVAAPSGDPPCVLDGTEPWHIAGVMLAAASNPMVPKCLEECSRARQRCEQQGAHRPGTQENIQRSKQCQESYNACMNGCK